MRNLVEGFMYRPAFGMELIRSAKAAFTYSVNRLFRSFVHLLHDALRLFENLWKYATETRESTDYSLFLRE